MTTAVSAGGDVTIREMAPDWPAALRDMGLREQRPFTRMYRAGAAPPGRPDLVFAAFGPELG